MALTSLCLSLVERLLIFSVLLLRILRCFDKWLLVFEYRDRVGAKRDLEELAVACALRLGDAEVTIRFAQQL
jgi:hypothetical protein